MAVGELPGQNLAVEPDPFAGRKGESVRGGYHFGQ